MKNHTHNIEYFFLKRSALQFRQDLSDIGPVLDNLSEEQIIGVASYIKSIRHKIKYIEDELNKKMIDM